ncbi:ribosomal protein L7/L12 [filamentous cyanobacterium LEGE 11480]|uniref:Ribosomal protein L7/L12 n=1 Tax=Romeriopsis navalis LEGE 11480 TaxID=2777977 RepID=A0A928VQJ0_9CYAN|nr:ribosomal protein L7/L12 [Romeriopsis navalis]MBE9031091.1 ribosomal protein L7/L12 [Romeriopsis navalis LEGE 11480]
MAPRFEIVVESFPADHIPVLRAMRSILGSGLKETKELLNYAQTNCPCVLLAGMEQAVAETMANQLISAGVTANIQTSSLRHPMLISPNFDQRYETHWLFGLRQVSEDD